MVNKQYIIHNPKFFKTTIKNQSPPPIKRNFPIISSIPNPQILQQEQHQQQLQQQQQQHQQQKLLSSNNLDTISEETTTFGRNIKYQNKNDDYDNEINCDRLNPNKDISINDIGRFQYILQMDREMGTHPDTLYRLPSRPLNNSSPSSNSDSINSSSQIKFWKAGSQTPMTSQTNSSKFYKYLQLFWHYGKWPIALLLILSILFVTIYFLVVETDISDDLKMKNKLLYDSRTTPRNIVSIETDLIIDINDLEFDDMNTPTVINGHAGNYNNLTFIDDENFSTNDTEEEFIEIIKTPNLLNSFNSNNSNLLTIFIKSTSTTTSTEQYFDDETTKFIEKVTEHGRDYEDITRTTNNGNREEQQEEISTPLSKPSTKIDNKKRKLIFPTKETLQLFGFTSGHQNNFGIPIEEDERILRLLNAELFNIQKNESQQTTTTDSSVYRTRVSPTLPIFQKFEITTEGLTIVNVTDDGLCQSTLLPMCRGILHYDLTNSNPNMRLSILEEQHFQYLVDSHCSLRVAEFVCAFLEPECRPKQMGTLKPCKRICKSVLEPCAHIIASSEVLTTTFDCDSYPDSNDRNECEDPTRRSKCYDNEFRCLDTTCIPLQWKCDNIKDCSEGEDEDDCKFCERDEFRCQTNDKCIPDKWRCDRYDDCPDASDEVDCFEDESRTFPTSYGTSRTFPFAHEQLPGSPNSKPYLTISGEDRLNSAERKIDDEEEFEEDTIVPTGAENIPTTIDDLSQIKNDADKDEIQKVAASGRIIPSISKTLGNFQDSKEIMMTSDSEADYKYSSTDHSTTAHASPCPTGELRCISGRCITVSQLCDKTTDCDDGADEAMCLYEN